MRWLILLSLVAITTVAFPWLFETKTAASLPVAPSANKTTSTTGHAAALLRLKKYGTAIKTYAAGHRYNPNFCFLVDMKLASGTDRFFVYDLKKDSILKAGLVANGYGGGSSSSIHFSNVKGSNCTSLGKYKIGKSYHGRFGLAYKLYGLDATNSNAFNRFVVLHAHECVPAAATSSQGICMSQGCPTVSPAFLNSLKGYLDKTDLPVLLWIYY